MSSKPAFERFEGTADRYAQFRPAYLPSLLRALQDDLRREPPIGGMVLDVGAGTGIFTRQLRGILADSVEVIGIEPGNDMRSAAIAGSRGLAKLKFVEGAAEKLPIDNGVARAVFSATAAHWFDRPRYYAEVARVLKPRGLFGIVQYLRDIEHSAAAKASVDFLTNFGEPWAYDRPDYGAELRLLAQFDELDFINEYSSLALTPAQFVGLMLSSSHGRPAIERLGQHKAEEEAYRVADGLKADNGMIDYGYNFQAFTVRRK